MTLQVLAAILGTVAFSALFGAPRKYYLLGGVTGGAAWLIYSGLLHYAGCTATEATLLATLGAVSYTHLDVYKRQVFACSPGARLNAAVLAEEE